MTHLVLSLFPGIDLFGMAFEREGFCVVRGPDLIYAADVHDFHPPRGKFDVVIGGPPCKSFSTAHRGNTPNQGNLIPEFERIVAEAQPAAFVMENVTEAPVPRVRGYAIKAFRINAHHYGANQTRIRRFSFGYRNHELRPFPFELEPPLPRRERTPDPFPTVMACEHKFPGGRVAGALSRSTHCLIIDGECSVIIYEHFRYFVRSCTPTQHLYVSCTHIQHSDKE